MREYLSVLGPFEVFVTVVVLAGLIYAFVLVWDAVIRAIMREEP